MYDGANDQQTEKELQNQTRNHSENSSNVRKSSEPGMRQIYAHETETEIECREYHAIVGKLKQPIPPGNSTSNRESEGRPISRTQERTATAETDKEMAGDYRLREKRQKLRAETDNERAGDYRLRKKRQKRRADKDTAEEVEYRKIDHAYVLPRTLSRRCRIR